MSEKVPEGHPDIDWSKWEPAGEGDVRSPCPMINALANHHILPHSGHGITKEMAVSALTSALNISHTIANLLTSVAVTANPDKSAQHFDLNDLNKHGLIEHDVSLSRNDFLLGDNHTFDQAIFDAVMETYGLDEKTSFETVSKARYERLAAAKKAHEQAGKDFQYGIKEFVISYGESAFLLGLLGDPKEGKIPVEFLRVLFEEERIPFKEGWRKSEKEITQEDVNHLIFKLFEANEHKAAEAKDVGFGTVNVVTTAVTDLLPTHCTIM